MLHLYRVVALSQALAQGVLFPRWLPDLAYGYGLPLFNFYAPLSYYPPALLVWLGLSPVIAFNLSLALALLISSSGVYLLINDVYGRSAGVLASVLYIYAPYNLLTVFFRGSSPIVWAWAIAPWVLWAFGRLLTRPNLGYLVLSAGLGAAVLLMHNISSLILLPTLVIYLAMTGLAQPTWATYRRAIIALGLSLGLAAFFLLPAVVEKELAQVHRAITPPDFDYRFNFVELGDLLAWPQPANTGLLNPAHTPRLGLVAVSLAVMSLVCQLKIVRQSVVRGVDFLLGNVEVGSYRLSHFQARLSGDYELYRFWPSQSADNSNQKSILLWLFAWLMLLATIFMTLPISVGIWDSLPLFAFIQQPHRLLSLAALMLAILAGAAVAPLAKRWQVGLTSLAITLQFLTAVPLLYPRYYEPPPEATFAGMMSYERHIGAIGTTSFGEYLPVWVTHTPGESPLEPAYQELASSSDIAQIPRLDQAYLPAGATLEKATYRFNQARLIIDSPTAYQAVFHHFYFPGWQATVDGQPAEIGPFSERGLIAVSVPAGRHTLTLQFQETPVRQLANLISLVTGVMVGLLILVAGYRWWFPKVGSSRFSEVGAAEAATTVRSSRFSGPRAAEAATMNFTRQIYWGYWLLAVILILSKSLFFDHYDSPLKRSFEEGQVIPAAVQTQVNFGNQLILLGYDLSPLTVESGGSFEITAYWQIGQPLETDYSILAHLVDEVGQLYAGQDNLHPGNLPTSRWSPGGFGQDRHQITVPAGTPPGDYFIVLGPYQPTSWHRLPVVAGGVDGWPDVFPIPVRVTPASDQPTLAQLDILWSYQQRLTPELTILGATPERETIRPNDFLRIAIFWQAAVKPTTNYQVSLQLVNQTGELIQSQTNQPSHNRYPTIQWSAGERVRDNQALWLPADLSPGEYYLQVQLLTETGQPVSEWLTLGSLLNH